MVFLDLPENIAINAVYPTALVLTIDLTCSGRVQSKYQRVVALRQRVLYADAPFAYLHPLPPDETFLSEWPAGIWLIAPALRCEKERFEDIRGKCLSLLTNASWHIFLPASSPCS